MAEVDPASAEELSTGARQPEGEPPEEFKHLPEREIVQRLALRRLFAEQEHGLRQIYANWIIWLLGLQFVIADTVFVAFGWRRR